MIHLYAALLISNAVFLFHSYLSIRQYLVIRQKKPSENVVKLYPKEKIKQAFEYNLDKIRLSFFRTLISQIVENLLLLFYAHKKLWDYSGLIFSSEIAKSITFCIVYGIIMHILDLPFDIYSTFLIEGKYGFNKQTSSLYVSDQIKVLIISLIFGIPSIAALIKIIRACGALLPFYCWLFMFAMQIFVIMIFPSVIQPLFNKFSALESGELKEKIERLSATMNFPLKQIYVTDGSKRSTHSNAYFFGLLGNKRIVIYDTLLEGHWSVDEICAVVAHELGHWRHGHMWKRFLPIQAQYIVLFVSLSILLESSSFFFSFGFDENRPAIIALTLVSIYLAPVLTVFGIILNYQSRLHEYEADSFAVQQNLGLELKQGLIKINTENLAYPAVDSLYSTAYLTHPTLSERLDQIEVQMKKSS